MGETLPLFRASFNQLHEIMARTRMLELLAGRLARCSSVQSTSDPSGGDQPEAKAEGRRVCIELTQALKEVSGVAGVHIMAPNQSMESVARVIDEAGLRGEQSVA